MRPSRTRQHQVRPPARGGELGEAAATHRGAAADGRSAPGRMSRSASPKSCTPGGPRVGRDPRVSHCSTAQGQRPVRTCSPRNSASSFFFSLSCMRRSCFSFSCMRRCSAWGAVMGGSVCVCDEACQGRLLPHHASHLVDLVQLALQVVQVSEPLHVELVLVLQLLLQPLVLVHEGRPHLLQLRQPLVGAVQVLLALGNLARPRGVRASGSRRQSLLSLAPSS